MNPTTKSIVFVILFLVSGAVTVMGLTYVQRHERGTMTIEFPR